MKNEKHIATNQPYKSSIQWKINPPIGYQRPTWYLLADRSEKTCLVNSARKRPVGDMTNWTRHQSAEYMSSDNQTCCKYEPEYWAPWDDLMTTF